MVKLVRRKENKSLALPDSLSPLLKRIYRQRKLNSAAELELGLANLISPDSMKGMDDACNLLMQALSDQSRLLIVADYDADGATSCALSMLALRQMGAAHVDYLVPNRFEFGYGLTPEIIELAMPRKPDLIITVDNGISSTAGVAAAQAAGIKVLITDHHLAPEVLPSADAIVNPNQPGCNFASKCIAGVGVIFYVMLALRSRLRKAGWFESGQLAEPNLAQLLDLVALGTVADVVAMDRNNRILVNEGLKRIRAASCRSGILELGKVAKRNCSQLTSMDLAFGLGPRLNAAGRLNDMSVGIECLMANEQSKAEALANQLHNMNEDRRQIESEMKVQAQQVLEEMNLEAEKLPSALCLYDKRWHQGVIGILASRVTEQYHRPVIAFARADEEGSQLKGSARSVKGFHIRDAIYSVACRHSGLITKFGGHAMAAGLSLDKNNLKEFEEAFCAEAERLLGTTPLHACVESDGPVPANEMTIQSAETLRYAGPWGQGFPQPVFNDYFISRQMKWIKDKHLRMKLSPCSDPNLKVDAIAFNLNPEQGPTDNCVYLHLVFRLDINEYRNTSKLQLLVEHVLGFC
ncbi:MAG: single-stranded-DNA-specific exonuclease RecJ [Gammaproteobacteria bacterium]|nr:single-stranded-DNA-specific exonuclease RecJ [Gammaproteobacteria bacterium]